MEQYVSKNDIQSNNEGWIILIGDTITILDIKTFEKEGLNVIWGYDVKNERTEQEFFLSYGDYERIF